MVMKTISMLLCDYCGAEGKHVEQMGPPPTRRELQAAATSWIRKLGDDVCPKCARDRRFVKQSAIYHNPKPANGSE